MQKGYTIERIQASLLQIDEKAMSAFSCTKASIYMINTEQLSPLFGKSLLNMFELPMVYEQDKQFYVFANWLFLQHQFDGLLKNSSDEIDVILFPDKPQNIGMLAWHYTFYCFLRSHDRKYSVSNFYNTLLESPSVFIQSAFIDLNGKIKKSTLLKVCYQETRQSLATQLKGKE